MIKIRLGVIVATAAVLWGSTIGIIMRHVVTGHEMTPNQRSIFEELLAVGIVAAFAVISVWVATRPRNAEEVDADTTRMLIEVGRIIERREAQRKQTHGQESPSHIRAV